MLRGLPRSGAVIRPQPLFYVALLRRGSGLCGAGTATAMGLVAQSTPATSPYGMRSRPPDR